MEAFITALSTQATAITADVSTVAVAAAGIGLAVFAIRKVYSVFRSF